MSSIYVATAERLQDYDLFDQYVIDETAYVANLQSRLSYGEFLDQFEIPEPTVEHCYGTKPLEVLDIIPRVDYDETQARVMYLGMGNRLDASQVYQIATVFAVDPTVRTIAFGNPSGPIRRAGAMTLRECWEVSRGDTRPLIDGPLQYIASQGISVTEQNGFSYGTLPVMAAAEHAERYDQRVDHMTTIEPADIKDRGANRVLAMLSLFGDFAATGGPLKDYVETSGIEAYSEARHDTVLGLANYLSGVVLRPTNLARASVLAGGHYEVRAMRALNAQPGAQLDLIRGSESELAVNGVMNVMANYLKSIYKNRVRDTVVPGGRHNMVNDIHLQAALLTQARAA